MSAFLMISLFLLAPAIAFFATTPYLPTGRRIAVSLFFPASMIAVFFGAQAYFEASPGPMKGPSDDGRGIGTAFIYIAAIPIAFAINAAMFLRFKRSSQAIQMNVSDKETP